MTINPGWNRLPISCDSYSANRQRKSRSAYRHNDGNLAMKILMDSNILIAAYPKPGAPPEAKAGAANSLLRLANEHGHTTYCHPRATQHDFGKIQNAADRSWRQQITSNHPVLPYPPDIQKEIRDACGSPKSGSNDWVDHHLLAAVVGHAVDILVTEDDNLHKKARRLGLGERIAHIEDGIATIQANVPCHSHVALLPQQELAHVLDEHDPIFESLRADYPGFDDWLQKCKKYHRVCWTVKSDGNLAALTIVKAETPAEYGPGGKTLKVCLFKVSEQHPGMRYGELLLKSVFDYAYANKYDSAYVTVFPKHRHLVAVMENFGFTDDGERKGDELVLAKCLKPGLVDSATTDLLDYHVKYGPGYYATNAPRFIVPIEPRYHDVLFPEAGKQMKIPNFSILSPAGNGILKAYLSRGSIRRVPPGSILYFYRSRDERCLSVVGIAEGIKASKSQSEIVSYVGKRTVYTQEEVKELTENDQREILAILFRQARVLRPGLTYHQMREAKICQAAPQSIMQVSDQAANWLAKNVDLRDR